jgi:hypothetical protein
LKAGDLVTPVGCGDAGFEKARAHRKQGAEAFTGAEQGFPAFDTAAIRDHRVEFLHLIGLEAHGQTQLAQIAAGTSDFDAGQIHEWLSVVNEHNPSRIFGRENPHLFVMDTPSRHSLTHVKVTQGGLGYSGSSSRSLL